MIKRILIGVVVFVLAVFSGVLTWMSIPYDYQEAVTDKVLTDNNITFNDHDWLVFGAAQATESGIIFYPGGKTAPETFAPVMQSLAEQGFKSVIVSMPFNTAFLGIDKAQAVMEAYPEIKNWHLIGHSLGGVAAGEFAKANPTVISSLIFWASYPATDISQLDVPALALSAEMDRMSTPEKIAEYRAFYPHQTEFKSMPASNHWQYGYFAGSKNVQENLRSREEQVAEVIQTTLHFINRL